MILRQKLEQVAQKIPFPRSPRSELADLPRGVHRLGKISAFVLALSLIAQQASTASTWDEQTKIGHEAMTRGDYGQAEKAFALALSEAAKFGVTDVNLSACLFNLAAVYQHQGKYSAAEPLFKQSLKISEKVFGPQNHHVAEDLLGLGSLYLEAERYSDAEPVLKRALAVDISALGPNHSEVAGPLLLLGSLYIRQKRYGEAESVCKRALAINEKVFGANNPEVIDNLQVLGHLYYEKTQLTDAEQMYKRALAITEKSFGQKHKLIASLQNGLGLVYTSQGRFADAEEVYSKALNSARGSGDKESTILDNMGSLYKSEGKLAEAEQRYKESLEILEKKYGLTSPELITSLNNLAVLQADRSNYSDAEAILNRARGIAEVSGRLNHPDTAHVLSTLAAIYSAQGKDDDAEALLRQVHQIEKDSVGQNRPDIVQSVDNLSRVQEQKLSTTPSHDIAASPVPTQPIIPDHLDVQPKPIITPTIQPPTPYMPPQPVPIQLTSVPAPIIQPMPINLQSRKPIESLSDSPTASTSLEIPISARKIAELAYPGTVMILSKGKHKQGLTLGSGFFVSDDIIATNWHVVENSSNAAAKTVGSNNIYPDIEIVATDKINDLALCRVGSHSSRWLELGDSEKMGIGDQVYVLGNPEGLEGTFSMGNVSAIREFGQRHALQITAPVSRGSSGGPVLNNYGKVVGISQSLLNHGQNLNFAIPSSCLLQLIDQFHHSSKKQEMKELETGQSVKAGDASQVRVTHVNKVGDGKCIFSIENKGSRPVTNIRYTVVAYDSEDHPVDSKENLFLQLGGINVPGTIPPGLAKVVSETFEYAATQKVARFEVKITNYETTK